MAVHKAIFFNAAVAEDIVEDIEIIQLSRAFNCTPDMVLDMSPEWIAKSKLILSEMANKEESDAKKKGPK